MVSETFQRFVIISALEESKTVAVSFRFNCVSATSDPRQVEILSDLDAEGITPFQVRQFAALVKGEAVKTATLRTWRNRIGIHPDASGCYALADLQLLGRYLEALGQGRTTAQFLNQEYGHAQQRSA
ncbi:hypothetical protein BH23CYA1_BH23CYA1_00020 [soil metagenome]